MEEKLKVGVWVENGIVFRRDSEKIPYPKKYTPKKPELLEEVLESVKRLHEFTRMRYWNPRIEYEVDQEIQKLRNIADF